MKREIVCLPCNEKIFKKLAKYEGEELKEVHGTCLNTYRCDCCGELLLADEPAVAVTLYLTNRYYSWEHNFLKVKGA